MRVAVVDIGSNTTRLLVADVLDGRLRPVEEARRYTRLASQMSQGRRLSPRALEGLETAVREQLQIARERGAERVRVIATAAVRAAENADEAVGAVGRAGAELHVVSEREEAEMAYLGALAALPERPGGDVGVADVGGGSTELVIGSPDGRVAWYASSPTGSAALAALPSERAAAEARQALAALAPPRRPAVAVAVGGEATEMVAAAAGSLNRRSLASALADLDSLGLDADRRTLLPGAIAILGAVIEIWGEPLLVAHGGLREGAALRLAR